jgi:glyoxylase-like metal-dependent hydrolase (beta-lactamase superfamily II)
VPVPFPEAGGPANVYAIDEADGGVALFDAGIGTREGREALLAGFRAIGKSLGEVRRIFVSHGHIDHYGYARAAQEESGAPVYCHVRDHDKVSGRERNGRRLELWAAYLARLGAPAEVVDHVRVHWHDVHRMARPIEHVLPLEPGTRLRFSRFGAEVLHLPGHTPGLTCLWDSAHGLLFSDDHLLERVSPNPLLDLEGEAEPRHKALVEYLRSAGRARELPANIVAPGHGEPFGGHAAVIDRLLAFYEKRQARILELLGDGPQTAAQLAPRVFPRSRPAQLFLVLSEVVGNLEVLEQQGKAARSLRNGRIVFERA